MHSLFRRHSTRKFRRKLKQVAGFQNVLRQPIEKVLGGHEQLIASLDQLGRLK